MLTKLGFKKHGSIINPDFNVRAEKANALNSKHPILARLRYGPKSDGKYTADKLKQNQDVAAMMM